MATMRAPSRRSSSRPARPTPAPTSSPGTATATRSAYGARTPGTLTLANSYTYDTWGKPTTATHNSIADLGFRFLYVGEADVQWDDAFGLGLLYMHARHYSPTPGPLPAARSRRLEANVYVYGENGPVTKVDPSGLFFESTEINNEEKRLCRAYPSRCEQMKRAASYAVSLTALAYSGWVKNAMRHCIWQCVLTYLSGTWWAKRWGWANRAVLSQAYWERRLDLHNNWIGRLLGAEMRKDPNFIYGPSFYAKELCRGAWNRGWLWARANNRTIWSDGRVVSTTWLAKYNPNAAFGSEGG